MQQKADTLKKKTLTVDVRLHINVLNATEIKDKTQRKLSAPIKIITKIFSKKNQNVLKCLRLHKPQRDTWRCEYKWFMKSHHFKTKSISELNILKLPVKDKKFSK